MTAEASTGGLLAMWLSNVEGPGTCYRGGWVGHELRLAAQLGLHFVPHLEPASRVANLAQHIRKQAECDYVLVVGDVVISDTDPSGPPIPKVYVALAGAGVSVTGEIQGLSDPTILKSRSAKTALDLLRQHLATQAVQGE